MRLRASQFDEKSSFKARLVSMNFQIKLEVIEGQKVRVFMYRIGSVGASNHVKGLKHLDVFHLQSLRETIILCPETI